MPATYNFDFNTFPLINKVRLTNPGANIDARYGPWPTALSALSAFDPVLREKGLTVAIMEGQRVAEYWYRDGIADSDLVLKVTDLDDIVPTVVSYLSSASVAISAIQIANGITAANGVNITSGTLTAPNVNLNGGAINNTSIGLTTPASGRFTGLLVTGNVSIDGNLFVAGSATNINTSNLIVKDPIIFLAEGNVGDVVEIGFTAPYNWQLDPHPHTGLLRNNATKEWTLFSGLTAEVLSAVNVNFNDPSLVIDTFRANLRGTVTGNVSGTAAQAVRFVTGRTISQTGDISYTSPSFDGTQDVTAAATINNNAVTFAKIQNIATDTLLGRSAAGTGNVQTITCTAAGRALLDDATAADQRTTLGVGTGQSVTFAEVVVDNGTRSVISDVYNGTVNSGNTLTLNTFANANYNSAKFTVQIKNTASNARCAMEIIATKNNTTWEGTVYGIVDPSSLFTNVDIGAPSTTVNLEFTMNGVANYTVTVYAQAISD